MSGIDELLKEDLDIIDGYIERVATLEEENEKYKKAFKILSPYHGITNKEGRLEAIESSIEFIKKKITKHDSEDITCCTYCNIIAFSRYVEDVIKALKGGENQIND